MTLGTTEDGWIRARAEEELADALADVRRGIWRPPESSRSSNEPAAEPTFHEFASETPQSRNATEDQGNGSDGTRTAASGVTGR